MKHITVIAIFLSLLSSQAFAVPACPFAEKTVQPDGSTLTLQLHGDEFYNYTTTADGYTVLKNSGGYYVYARQSDGQLVETGQIARDAEIRNEAEKTFLQSVQKNLMPVFTEQAQAKKRNAVKLYSSAQENIKKSKFDYSKFRGLVILVEYNDCPFIREDAHDVFNGMINDENYKGFMSDTPIPELISYTGSVHDYFVDNSQGQFSPKFDVVGPVQIDYSALYPNETSYASTVVNAALNAADEFVNFKDYDTDGDGKVDMVYFIFSGPGSNYSGNASGYIWPHASTVTGKTLDGVSFGRYACSTELYGRPASKIIDGIGTVCHEFGHVLGLLDEYDTDYAGSGGQSINPAHWSVMAGGSYLNQARTPCGYSLLERYMLGFSTPELVSSENEGTYTLKNIDTSNHGYRIDSAIKDEYFLLENRQKTKWNAYLPGHGMLVFRVDSTNTAIWAANDLNVNPAHNYYELLRANPKASGTAVTDSDGDPFPGSGNITSITNETSPALKSWTGYPTEVTISDIAEDADNVITFKTTIDKTPSETEDFETMPLTMGDTINVPGRFTTWNFTKATVEAPALEYCSGMQAVGLVKKGEIVSATIPSSVQTLSFNAINASSQMAIIRCSYSTNGGTTWIAAKTLDAAESITLASGSSQSVTFGINTSSPAKFKISEFTGSATGKCYIDNLIFKYSEYVTTAISTVEAGATGSTLKAVRQDGGITLSGITADSAIKIYTPSGVLVKTVMPEDETLGIQLPAPGFYIVSQNGKSVKVIY